MSDSTPPSLYAWAGGAEAFQRLMARFYDQVHQDPILAPVFAHMDARHAAYVADFVAECPTTRKKTARRLQANCKPVRDYACQFGKSQRKPPAKK